MRVLVSTWRQLVTTPIWRQDSRASVASGSNSFSPALPLRKTGGGGGAAPGSRFRINSRERCSGKACFPHEREPERGCAVTGTYPAIRMDAVLSTHGPGDVQVTNICSPGLDLATNLG